MKIGVFSDVHGCTDELVRTLDLLATLNVDALVCAGDLVDKGPDSDGAVRLMAARGIPCVRGNHDRQASFSGSLAASTLSTTAIDYLSTLPDKLTDNWAGVSVCVCHANPWHDPSVYVYPSRPAALFELVALAVPAQIIIMGHTHHPMRVEHMGKLLLNPGSIYGNRDRATRTCAVLTLPDMHFDLYDIASGQRTLL